MTEGTKILSNQEIWAKLTEMPRPSVTVDFPRKDSSSKPVCQLKIWVLTQEEQMAAAASAEEKTRRLIKEVPRGDEAHRGYDDVYNNAAANEILFRACRDLTNSAIPFFPTVEHVRRLTADEVGVLMSHYLTAQSELGPIVSQLSKEELDSWINRLVESGNRFPLDLLSPELLKTLAISMALQLRSFLTDTSSPGSPPDNSTSDTSNNTAEDASNAR